MASSYTGNSGIEKPAQGDQTGEWGTTINTNMDIIDRSINGVLALTLTGTTTTVATTDGTLTDGMYKVLVLGGSPSGTNTITITPNDADKLYFVVNSSGQTATFTQGSGANVNVLNGDTAVIYCDGAGSGAAVADFTKDLGMSSVNIDGGSIDGTAIGGTTPAAGAFTTVAASGTLTGGTTIAVGDEAAASGTNSQAFGYSALASGTSSTAIGYDMTSSGNHTIALGYQGTVSGVHSTLLQLDTTNRTLSQANAFSIMGGNVGIGTLAPDTALSVAGEVSMTTLDIGGTNVTATAAELNYLDITTLGTSEASKAVTVDSSGDLLVPDSDKFKFGAGSDMQVYHDGTNSYVTNATGELKLATESSGIAIAIGHSTSEVTFGDNVTVTGNFDVNGTTTTIDTTNLTVTDPLVKFGQGYTGTAYDEGFIVTRGNGSASNTANKGLIWDESADEFAAIACNTEDGTTAGNVTINSYADLQVDKLTAGSLDIEGDADINGTLEADAMTLNGTAITATATLSTGISNTNVPVFTSGVADDDFLRVAGTSIEGRSAAEVLSDIGASAVAGSSSIVTTGALNAGSITSGFGAIDNGASAITTTGVITGGTVEATTDTAAGDNAAIGYTSAEGLILTGQGSTSDVTIKNDADATVLSIPTGTTKVGIGTTAPDSLVEISSGAATTAKIATTVSNNYAELIFEDGNAGYGFQVRSDGAQSIATGSFVINDRDTGTFPVVINEGAGTNTFKIDSAGRIQVNGTAVVDVGRISVSFDSANSTGVSLKATNANGGTIMRYQNSSAGSVGGITTNGSTTAFETSSDYRLKENVDYTFDATARLKQLKPARFNFISDASNTLVDGFLAHEVSTIVPEAISGEKDATTTHNKVVLDSNGIILASGVEQSDWTAGKSSTTDADGNTVPAKYPSDSTWEASKAMPDYQGIDQSKLVPLLVKTIQELEARITALEA